MRQNQESGYRGIALKILVKGGAERHSSNTLTVPLRYLLAAGSLPVYSVSTLDRAAGSLCV